MIKTIESKWNDLVKLIGIEDAPEMQKKEMRKAFFYGHGSFLLEIIKSSTSQDGKAFNQVMDAHAEEIGKFIDDETAKSKAQKTKSVN